MALIIERICVKILWLTVFQSYSLVSAGAVSPAKADRSIGFLRAHSKTSGYNPDTIPDPYKYDFYLSSGGSDSNNGKSPQTPKLSFQGLREAMNNAVSGNNAASIGLGAGSIFRDEFDVPRNNILVGSFGEVTGRNLPHVSGMDIVSDWTATPGRQNIYQSQVAHVVDLINPNYNYLFVAETDTTREKQFPVSSIRYLSLASSLDQCEKTPGTFYAPVLQQNPVTIYVHPTTGAPGSNGLRYEVVKRPYGIYGFYNNDCSFSNLHLLSSGNGYGMLAAGTNTRVENVVFQGGGTHHTVIQSGMLNRCLFLPGPKGLADEIAVVFYKASGAGSDTKISNSMFMDVKGPLFTHTDGSSNYRSLTVDSVYAYADTLNTYKMLSADNMDTVRIADCYANGFQHFWLGKPFSLSIRNSVINKVTGPAIYIESLNQDGCKAEVTNTLITTNITDANQRTAPLYQPSMGYLFYHSNTTLKVTHNIFHGHSTATTQNDVTTVYYNAPDNKLTASNNIYICDVKPGSFMKIAGANNASGKGSCSNITSDYNVYVLLSGSQYWTAAPFSPRPDNKILSLKEWQQYTGQDAHSIFIDLRNNPQGLRAVFVDPENGNWTLRQTPLGDSIRQLQAGMTTPPLYYPLKPLYEDAMDHSFPGGLSYLTGTKDLNNEVKLEWKMIREPALVYMGLEFSNDNVSFRTLTNVEPKEKNNDNVYNFVQTDSAAKRTYYRLRLVSRDSSFAYSPSLPVDPLRKDTVITNTGGSTVNIIAYPNPAQTSVTVEHPIRDQGALYLYDYQGRHLRTLPVLKGANLTTVPLQSLPSGNYFIKWVSGAEDKVIHIVKTP